MTLIDDLCDGCGGRFDPMGDPLLTRHPEISEWAVYCATCERKTTTAPEPREDVAVAASWHHACTCNIAYGWSLLVEHAEDCPFGRALGERERAAAVEALREAALRGRAVEAVAWGLLDATMDIADREPSAEAYRAATRTATRLLAADPAPAQPEAALSDGTEPTDDQIAALVAASPNITGSLINRLQKVIRQCEHIIRTDQGVNEAGLAWVRTILRAAHQEDEDGGVVGRFLRGDIDSTIDPPPVTEDDSRPRRWGHWCYDQQPIELPAGEPRCPQCGAMRGAHARAAQPVPAPEVDAETCDGQANDCTHMSATGIDTTSPRDPAKVWRCDHCGLRWRSDGPLPAPGVSRGVAEVKAEALREAASKVAQYRNGATGRRAANADLFGQMLFGMADDLLYQQERRDRADRRHAQDNPGPAQAPDSRRETER